MSKMTAESAENMPLTPSECIDDYQNKCSIHSLSILQPECYKENVGMYREMRNCEWEKLQKIWLSQIIIVSL